VLGVLCIVGCPMQLIREVFSRHTFASLWGAWLRFASLWRTNARGDSWVLRVHQSSVLLSFDNLPSFVAFCWVVIIFHRSSLKRAERLLKGCVLKLVLKGCVLKLVSVRSSVQCWVVIIFHRSSLKRAERLLKGCLLKLVSFKTAQYNFTLC